MQMLKYIWLVAWVQQNRIIYLYCALFSLALKTPSCYFGYFGMFEESPQLSTSGSARLLVTIQSNKLLLLAAM